MAGEFWVSFWRYLGETQKTEDHWASRAEHLHKFTLGRVGFVFSFPFIYGKDFYEAICISVRCCLQMTAHDSCVKQLSCQMDQNGPPPWASDGDPTPSWQQPPSSRKNWAAAPVCPRPLRPWHLSACALFLHHASFLSAVCPPRSGSGGSRLVGLCSPQDQQRASTDRAGRWGGADLILPQPWAPRTGSGHRAPASRE